MKTPVIISLKSIMIKNDEIKYIEKYKPFGIIFFSRNIQSIPQLKKLINNLKILSPSTLIFVDQESGIVDRFKFFKNLNFLDNYDYYKIYLKDKELAKTLIFLKSYITSFYLKEWGFDSNTVPVLDIPVIKTAKFISKRTFGPNLKIVKRLNEIIILNNINFGLIPVIKHIPGHGVTSKDSHKVLPTSNLSLNQLTTHFNSFKNFNYLPLAMASHIIYKKLDSSYMATFSTKIINQVIRKKINFKGLLMTDDLSMSAIKYNVKDICLLSNKSGMDLLLDCSNNIDRYIYFSENFKFTDRYKFYLKSKWLKLIPSKNNINIVKYRNIYDNILKNNGI